MTAWLIERYIKGRLHFWSAGARGRGFADDWSEDANFATRLADEESASQVLLHVCRGEGRAVEHKWVDAA